MTLALEPARRLPGLTLPGVVFMAWGALVLLTLLLARFVPAGVSACLFRNATGHPCAMCGGSRAARSLFTGDLTGAFVWNPLAAALIIGAVVYLVVRLVTRRAIVLRASTRTQYAMLAVGLVLVTVNWVYVASAGLV